MPNLKKENTAKNIKNFIPYGTDPEKDKMVRSVNWEDRRKMVKEGYGVDVLINDKDDKKHNKDSQVQKAMAEKGYDSDDLVKDDVPKKSKDVSINNEDLQVQKAVTKKGYGLDNLVKDLINDKDDAVQAAIVRFLKDQELTLLEFADRENIDLQINAYNIDIKSVEYKRMLFNSGLYTTEIYLKNPEMFTSSDNFGNTKDKDVIFNDNEDIRKMAAKQGYKLNVLISDKSSTVRQAVLDYLEKNDLTLKMWAEEYDKELDDFNIKNKPIEYKKAMIDSGLCLAELINDEDYDVRKTVLDYLKTRSITLSQWANYEEKSLDFNKLLNSPYEEVRLEAFRCVYRDSIDNLKNVGFPIDFKDMEDVKDHIFNNPTTCIKALRFLGDESVKSDEKYKEVLSILVSKSEELKEDHTSFPEKFNSFIKNGPYSVFKDFEKVRNGSLDINDPSISRFNTMKLEIQNLKNQISILTKENKSLQKTLEKYVSVEKETDEKEL